MPTCTSGARAQRYHVEQDRQRFVAGRAVLRIILAHYSGLEPKRLVLTYGAHGKPAVMGCGGEALRFNMAHSRDVALYAIARRREVGIDVEHIRDVSWDLSGMDQLAAYALSPREHAYVDRLPPARRTAAFFTLWTRKEALVKGMGTGLSHPPAEVDVPLPPRTPVAAPEDVVLHPPTWSLHELLPLPGCAAALAVEGPCERIVCWRYG